MLTNPAKTQADHLNDNPLSVLNRLVKCLFYWLLSRKMDTYEDITHCLPLTDKLTMMLICKGGELNLQINNYQKGLEGPVLEITLTSLSALFQTKQILEALLKTPQLLSELVDEPGHFFYHFEKEVDSVFLASLSTAMFNSVNFSKLANWYLYHVGRDCRRFTEPKVVYSTINKPHEESNQSKQYTVIAHRLDHEVYFTLVYTSNTFSTHVLVNPDFDWDFYGFNVNWLVSDLMDPKYCYQGDFYRLGKHGVPYCKS